MGRGESPPAIPGSFFLFLGLPLKSSKILKMRQDLESSKLMRANIGDKIINYLNEKGWAPEYQPKYLNEKYVLLDWVACQLVS